MRQVFFCNYTVGEGYDAYAICRPYGTKALLLGGEKALAAGGEALRRSLRGTDLTVEEAVYGTECTEAAIRRWGAYAGEIGADMIFGMGGGKALDTAKGAADAAGLPVFTFPTIAATCAGTTALSVLYREAGGFDRFAFFDRPARHCFLNLEILAGAPAEYLRAGMGETLAKCFECHFSARGDRLAHSSALGREISHLCYGPLLEHGVQALSDCRAHRVTEALEEAVLANIVSTGLVSLLVEEDYNGAAAHALYYGLALLPGFEKTYLHGDAVAYGVLVQLAIDRDWDRARELKAFLRALGIPTTLREMEVPLDREALGVVLREMVNGPDMAHIPYPVTEDMAYRAMEAVETLA